jgi:hypothetical protein
MSSSGVPRIFDVATYMKRKHPTLLISSPLLGEVRKRTHSGH